MNCIHIYISDSTCDQHTYVNTMEMNLPQRIKSSDVVLSNSITISPTGLNNDRVGSKSIASNSDKSCHVIDHADKLPEMSCMNGTVQKKLSIFERIKLLNNDALAMCLTPRDHSSTETRPKITPEPAILFREKSSEGTLFKSMEYNNLFKFNFRYYQ